jgi:hypothetical protein
MVLDQKKSVFELYREVPGLLENTGVFKTPGCGAVNQADARARTTHLVLTLASFFLFSDQDVC